MKRNWGIPPKDAAISRARDAKPVATLTLTAAFGVIGAALAAISFGDARDAYAGIFRGWSLLVAVSVAGFGCWLYIFLSWQRFAAQFSGGDAFSVVLRFYVRAAIALILLLLTAKLLGLIGSAWLGGIVLCLTGGAAAAAAFQTVVAFVPPADPPKATPPSGRA